MRHIEWTLLGCLAAFGCTSGPQQDTDQQPGPPGFIDTGFRYDTAPTGPETYAPIAVCEVDRNPIAPAPQVATFNGAASYSPVDRPLAGLEWQIHRAPTGSDAVLSSATGPSVTLSPELPGEYWVGLAAVDEDGLRSDEPCIIILTVVPRTQLTVQMSVSNNDDNIDLHVVRPGGQARTFDDCFSVTCIDGINWGQQELSSDDVALSIDRETGTQVMSVLTHEPGAYRVFVHDNPDAVWTEGTEASVSILLDDALVYSQTLTISGEDTDTAFAQVNPATGDVISQ